MNGALRHSPPEVRPESYFDLRREWHPGDCIELDLDMRCRRIAGPCGVNRAGDGRAAVAFGPVVLTRDEHFDPHFNEPADIVADSDGFIEARRILPPARRLAARIWDTHSRRRHHHDRLRLGRLLEWIPNQDVDSATRISREQYNGNESHEFVRPGRSRAFPALLHV